VRRVGVIGIGQLPFKSRYPDKLYSELAHQAASEAIADAGLMFDDIESVVYSVYSENMMLQGYTDAIVHEYLGFCGKPAQRVTAGASTGGHALKAAYNEVASGSADVVLLLGFQKCELIDLEDGHRGEGFLRVGATALDVLWHSPYTTMVPGTYGLTVAAHMERYGGPTPEEIARVSLKCHDNALLNPYAQLKVKLTIDEIMNSRLINSPSTMYECCLYSDGAAALILASEDRIRSIGKRKPVWITGCSAVAGTCMPQVDGTIPAISAAARLAYKQAGITDPRTQLDVVEVHDLISGVEVLSYEELGLCERGQGGALVREGAVEMTGDIPVNVSGGRVAAGHVAGVSGIFSMAEVVRQVRGEAEGRQVKLNSGRGLVQTLGGPAASFAAVSIFEAA
jgi:acetyl-CoA C-acetyltransferase